MPAREGHLNRFDLPKDEIPSGLNWDMWLGPLNADIHFNHELNPPISLDPPENEKMWGGLALVQRNRRWPNHRLGSPHV
jgi:hypothetical protein